MKFAEIPSQGVFLLKIPEFDKPRLYEVSGRWEHHCSLKPLFRPPGKDRDYVDVFYVYMDGEYCVQEPEVELSPITDEHRQALEVLGYWEDKE